MTQIILTNKKNCSIVVPFSAEQDATPSKLDYITAAVFLKIIENFKKKGFRLEEVAYVSGANDYTFMASIKFKATKKSGKFPKDVDKIASKAINYFEPLAKKYLKDSSRILSAKIECERSKNNTQLMIDVTIPMYFPHKYMWLLTSCKDWNVEILDMDEKKDSKKKNKNKKDVTNKKEIPNNLWDITNKFIEIANKEALVVTDFSSKYKENSGIATLKIDPNGRNLSMKMMKNFFGSDTTITFNKKTNLFTVKYHFMTKNEEEYNNSVQNIIGLFTK